MLILRSTTAGRPKWARYTLAVVSVGLATLTQSSLGPISTQSPFLLYLAAITITAWYSGLIAGLLASALSVLAAAYYFLPPYGALDISQSGTQIRLFLFALVALLINILSYARSMAETRAIEQGDRLRVTLESIGDAVMAVDTARRVTFMNAVAQELTGWSEAQSKGQRMNDVFHILNEDTRLPVDNPVDKVFTDGKVVGLANHTLLISRDGKETPIDDSSAPILDDKGHIMGAILVFRDISERRAVEKERTRLLDSEHQARLQAEVARYDAEAAQSRLSFLADVSKILVASLDYQTTLQAVARLAVPDVADWCAVDLLGEDGTLQRLAVVHTDPAKVAWAHELHRRYPPDPSAPTGPYNTIRTGKSEFYPEITDEMLVAAARDPEQLKISRELGITSSIAVPLIAREQPLGILSFVTAESGKKYTQDDVALAESIARRAASAIDNAKLYDEAQSAVKARDQFLSIAAHELKTPLTAMRAYTQLVQRRIARSGQVGEKDLEALSLVVKQTYRLDRMIVSLLDLSRIETGQLSLDTQQVDLCALVRHVVEETRPTLQGHKLETTVPESPLIINGDELRLEQVILNLLQNAVKYDPDNGKIHVAVERKGRTACVIVADEGIGIPETAQPKLFQRFYRAANANQKRIDGMGIGLYVVREIVALHKGEISVKSKEGEGSTFTVCLPMAEPSD